MRTTGEYRPVEQSRRSREYTESRLSSGEVARDVLRGSGGREGARQPEEDDAAALAALREAHGLPIVEKLTEDSAS